MDRMVKEEFSPKKFTSNVSRSLPGRDRRYIVYTMFLSQFLEKSQLDSNIFLNHTFYSSYNLLSTDVRLARN